MEVTVRGKNLDVTPALRDYVQKKLGKLDRYVGPGFQAQVTLEVERGRHQVEVTVPLDGFLLRGVERTDDMYASMDLVLDKLERQIEKYRAKLARRFRQAGSKVPPYWSEGVAEEGGGEPLLRHKRFPLKPMDVDEAILQMNLLGHDFFVFTNAMTEQVNVVYRRRSGDYGLIEPEH